MLRRGINLRAITISCLQKNKISISKEWLIVMMENVHVDIQQLSFLPKEKKNIKSLLKRQIAVILVSRFQDFNRSLPATLELNRVWNLIAIFWSNIFWTFNYSPVPLQGPFISLIRQDQVSSKAWSTSYLNTMFKTPTIILEHNMLFPPSCFHYQC